MQKEAENTKRARYAECIAFTNHKGGTGKTTSCLSVAGYFAKMGAKVLVVDFDPQANATSGLGIDGGSIKHSICDVVLGLCEGYQAFSISGAIVSTYVDNIHLVPSQTDLAAIEMLMQGNKDRTIILRQALEEIRGNYDYILIDLPPAMSLLTINGLRASDQIVVPLDPSIYSLEALDNLKVFFNDIKEMTGHSLHQITVVLTRYVRYNFLFDRSVFSRMFFQDNPSREIIREIKKKIHPLFIVPECTGVYKSQKQGLPISHCAPKSKAAKAYEKLAMSLNFYANYKLR